MKTLATLLFAASARASRVDVSPGVASQRDLVHASQTARVTRQSPDDANPLS